MLTALVGLGALTTGCVVGALLARRTSNPALRMLDTISELPTSEQRLRSIAALLECCLDHPEWLERTTKGVIRLIRQKEHNNDCHVIASSLEHRNVNNGLGNAVRDAINRLRQIVNEWNKIYTCKRCGVVRFGSPSKTPCPRCARNGKA